MGAAQTRKFFFLKAWKKTLNRLRRTKVDFRNLATASIDNLKKEYYTNIKISIARGATSIWLRTKCKFCTLEPESGNADVGKRFGA